MTDTVERGRYGVPVDHDRVAADWAAEGFSFGVFRDPPGQAWNDFVHRTDEYVVVAEGEMEVTVGRERFQAGPGDLVRIPRGVPHSLRTLSGDGSVWLYGYGDWERDDG